MTLAVFALTSFCGKGSIRLFDIEHEARESLALANALGCGEKCTHTHNHKLIQLGEFIA